MSRTFMEGNKDKLGTNVAVFPVGGSQQSIQNYESHENVQENSYHLREMYASLLSRDLFLFENQIPFIVVTKIHELVIGGRTKISLLVENVVESMKDVVDCLPKAIK